MKVLIKSRLPVTLQGSDIDELCKTLNITPVSYSIEEFKVTLEYNGNIAPQVLQDSLNAMVMPLIKVEEMQ